MSGWAGREVGPGPGGDCYSFECEIFNINLIKFGSVTKTKLAGLVAGRVPGVRCCPARCRPVWPAVIFLWRSGGRGVWNRFRLMTANSLDAAWAQYLQFMAISRLILRSRVSPVPGLVPTRPRQYSLFEIVHHFNCLKYDIEIAIIIIIKYNFFQLAAIQATFVIFLWSCE